MQSHGPRNAAVSKKKMYQYAYVEADYILCNRL